MQSLTLDDQDVERLLNCLDEQARLPTAMHGSRWPTRSLRTSSSAHHPDARRTRCCERHPGVQDWSPERGAFPPDTPPSARPVTEWVGASADAAKEIAAVGKWSGHAEDPDTFSVLRAMATTTSARSSTALDLTT
jgi:hypothetical protein